MENDKRPMPVCEIMGVNIAVTDMEKTVRCVEEHLEDWRGEYICVANVHTTVTAHDDPTYLEVQNGAVLALPDGGPLSQYSRRKGFADAARVTGPDLMKEMLRESAQKHYRHYFYGSTPETLDILRRTITENYPGAVIAGMFSPPFRPLTPAEDAAAVAAINEAHPDFVWVGLGAPKQERWMAHHQGAVHALNTRRATSAVRPCGCSAATWNGCTACCRTRGACLCATLSPMPSSCGGPGAIDP